MNAFDRFEEFEDFLFSLHHDPDYELSSQVVDDVLDVGFNLARQVGCESSDDKTYFPMLDQAVYLMKNRLCELRPDLKDKVRNLGSGRMRATPPILFWLSTITQFAFHLAQNG